MKKVAKSDQILKKVKALPKSPGVYLMKNARGGLLYIGKAKSLRVRVGSYFLKKNIRDKTTVMIQQVRDIDHIQTPSEIEALLLEAQLINQYQPPYNIRLRDDKSFPYIEVTKEKYPQVRISRKMTGKGAKYYGPYTDARLLREALRMIHEIFPLRKCKTLCKEICLYNHIGQCLAPQLIDENRETYEKTVQNVCSFLEGKKEGVIEWLSAKMNDAAKNRRFEDAQMYKNQMNALKHLESGKMQVSYLKKVQLKASLALKKILKLKRVTERIVCFDVSNIAGTNAVASRVSFYRELPEKMAYRRYKIHNVFQINDYAMIQEALGRMCRGIMDGTEVFIPDLIVIDGGLGHLHAAEKTLAKEHMTTTPIISIAKRFESIYIAGSKHPLVLPRQSAALHLIQKVRDEAHRFAISYHRKLRGEQLSASILDQIPGIGQRRKNVLLGSFSSIAQIRETPAHQIAALPGMNGAVADKIKKFFRDYEVD